MRDNEEEDNEDGGVELDADYEEGGVELRGGGMRTFWDWTRYLCRCRGN